MSAPNQREEIERSRLVRLTVTVDRPDLRGPTYRPVPAGHVVERRETLPDHASALRRLSEVLAGEEDFGSEYVSAVEILRRDYLREGFVSVHGPIGRERRKAVQP